MPLLLVAACVRTGDPGSDEHLESVKIHDIQASAILATPLLPGLGRTERVPVMGSVTTGAYEVLTAQLPAGLDPDTALVRGAAELTRRGVRFARATCPGVQGGSLDGTATITSSLANGAPWPASVSFGTAPDGEPVMAGPVLTIRVDVQRGTPAPLSSTTAEPAPATCPTPLPLG